MTEAIARTPKVIRGKKPYAGTTNSKRTSGVCWFPAREYEPGDGGPEIVPDEIFDLMRGETLTAPNGATLKSTRDICRFKTYSAAKAELARALFLWAGQ